MAILHIQGCCPMGCGETLYVSADDPSGLIRCSNDDCPDPNAAFTILSDSETEHIVTFTGEGFTIRHPLKERLDDRLMHCMLHRYLTVLGRRPVSRDGRYRAKPRGWAVSDVDGLFYFVPLDPEPEPAHHPDQVARAFHEAYERLAPEFGYQTREDSAVPWADVPEQNKKLMIATVKALLDDGYIQEAD